MKRWRKSSSNCNHSYVEAGVCFWKVHAKYGDDSQWVTPVPISNTEVKPLNAENSVKAKIGRCQTKVKIPEEYWISPLFFQDFNFRLATSYFRFDTIFGVQWLNYRVRDGNGCDPLAIVTILLMDLSKTNTSFDITVVTVIFYDLSWPCFLPCFWFRRCFDHSYRKKWIQSALNSIGWLNS